MRAVDELLEDDVILDAVYEPQGRRHSRSRTRGRHQTPSEVVLRMRILKHVRNWSYQTLEREVRARVVYRRFCRIGMEKVPDAQTLVRLGQTVGPEAIRELHDRLVAMAQERNVIRGRKMRVDTTVVESNIHYPTDSGLLNDGARVLTRTMKKIEQKTGGLKKKIRDRKRDQAGKRNCTRTTPQGAGRRRKAQTRVPGTSWCDAADTGRCAKSSGRSRGAGTASPDSGARIVRASPDHGRSRSQRDTANQGAHFRRTHQAARQARQFVRTAY